MAPCRLSVSQCRAAQRDFGSRERHAAPGGAIVVQDYSVTGSLAAEVVWTLVCWLVIIPLSWLTSCRTRLYHYLWRSVRRFDSVPSFVDRLCAARFTDVEVRTARGWQRGILHTFRARTPAMACS